MTKTIDVWMMFDDNREPVKDMNGMHIIGDKKDVEYFIERKSDNVHEATISWEEKEE